MEKTMTFRDHAIAGGLFETLSRYGSAGAEFWKGFRGVDYETGRVFDRSLRKVAGYRINPQDAERNIKQQAGYAAEITSVSKRNARAIIDKSGSRFFRSDDIAAYGKNHSVVDIVELMDGEEITSQMKFVTNQENLLRKIACGEGGGKTDLSRYMVVDRLEVPSEQVESMKQHCRDKAEALQRQIDKNKTLGNMDIVEKKTRQMKNYRQLEEKITDSGMTTKEAVEWLLHPYWSTLKAIAGISNEAGIQGAKLGLAIGGAISAISNAIAFASGNKEFGDAVRDTGKDTLVSIGAGYLSAFSGTFIKACMQQSGSVSMRALSKTGFPAAVVSVCLAAGKSVNKYARGQIDEETLVQEMSLTASGMLSASMFTMVGQLAIPVPVLGGMIGGMVGYAITNSFYQSFFDVLKERNHSAEHLQILEMQCAAAKAISGAYQQALQDMFGRKAIQLDAASHQLFVALNRDDIAEEEFCAGINQFAELLGKTLSINNMAELDSAMASDRPLTI